MATSLSKGRFVPVIEDLSTEIVQSEKDFCSLKDEWDSLFQSAKDPCVFLSFNWSFTWWKHAGKHAKLFIILVRENGTLVGVAPFVLKKRFGMLEIHMMGDLQYFSPLVREDRADIPVAIADTLSRSFSRGLIFVKSSKAGDFVMDILAAALKSMNWYESRWVRDISHYIHEEQGYECLLSKKSSKSRNNLKRERKLLEKQGMLEISYLKGSNITNSIIDRVASIQDRSWLKRRGQEPLNSGFWKEAILALSDTGNTEIAIMTFDGTDVAYTVSLCSGQNVFLTHIGFDENFEKFSPGKSLMASSIQSALDNGRVTYDFLFGDAEYKRFWGNRTAFVYSHLYCKGIMGWLVSWFPYRLHGVFGRYQSIRKVTKLLRRLMRDMLLRFILNKK